nr:acyloxyacyl hydrolase [Bacteroidota bacterium]
MISLFLIETSFPLFGQNSGSSFASGIFIEAKIHQGFLISHHPEMLSLTNGFFPSYEFSLLKQTTGKQHCHYLRNYPQIGITYRYSTHGGSRYLGESHSIIPFINFPLLKKTAFSMSFKVGLGVGYLTRKFDRIENYKNLAIGSHYNAAINFQVQMKVMISHRIYLNAGLSMFHLSNGTIKTPNYGLNIPSVFAGITYKITRKEIAYKIPEIIESRKGKTNFNLIIAGAAKEISKQYDVVYNVYVASGSLTRYYNNVNKILIGFDMVYDESNIALMERAGDTIQFQEQAIKYGLNAGHEWAISNLSLYLSLGYYIYSRYKSDGVIYNKLGVNYLIDGHINLSLILSAYYARADYLALGIGITF